MDFPHHFHRSSSSALEHLQPALYGTAALSFDQMPSYALSAPVHESAPLDSALHHHLAYHTQPIAQTSAFPSTSSSSTPSDASSEIGLSSLHHTNSLHPVTSSLFNYAHSDLLSTSDLLSPSAHDSQAPPMPFVHRVSELDPSLETAFRPTDNLSPLMSTLLLLEPMDLLSPTGRSEDPHTPTTYHASPSTRMSPPRSTKAATIAPPRFSLVKPALKLNQSLETGDAWKMGASALVANLRHHITDHPFSHPDWESLLVQKAPSCGWQQHDSSSVSMMDPMLMRGLRGMTLPFVQSRAAVKDGGRRPKETAYEGCWTERSQRCMPASRKRNLPTESSKPRPKKEKCPMTTSQAEAEHQDDYVDTNGNSDSDYSNTGDNQERHRQKRPSNDSTKTHRARAKAPGAGAGASAMRVEAASQYSGASSLAAAVVSAGTQPQLSRKQHRAGAETEMEKEDTPAKKNTLTSKTTNKRGGGANEGGSATAAAAREPPAIVAKPKPIPKLTRFTPHQLKMMVTFWRNELSACEFIMNASHSGFDDMTRVRLDSVVSRIYDHKPDFPLLKTYLEDGRPSIKDLIWSIVRSPVLKENEKAWDMRQKAKDLLGFWIKKSGGDRA